jgi:mRNA interferase RelE/StbE
LAWTIEFDEKAERDLAKLDKSIQKRIRRYLVDRVATAADPRSLGHTLRHDLAHLWRFRVQDYRIVCSLEDDRLIVLVVAIGHRSSIYGRLFRHR